MIWIKWQIAYQYLVKPSVVTNSIWVVRQLYTAYVIIICSHFVRWWKVVQHGSALRPNQRDVYIDTLYSFSSIRGAWLSEMKKLFVVTITGTDNVLNHI